jgi:hypothetical protein
MPMCVQKDASWMQISMDYPCRMQT